MRRASVAILVLLVFFLQGCQLLKGGYPKQVVIKVTSFPSGKHFWGYYANTEKHISVESDVTPARYEIELKSKTDIVTTLFCKEDPGGWQLKVEIYVDGELKKENSVDEEDACIDLTYSDMVD